MRGNIKTLSSRKWKPETKHTLNKPWLFPGRNREPASRGIFLDYPAVLNQLFIADKNTIQIGLNFYKTINGLFFYREEESNIYLTMMDVSFIFLQYYDASAV